MKALRSEAGGCPWTRAQTMSSILPFTLEEAYELGQAIDDGNPSGIAEELGDLLYHVIFYACIAEESGQFSLDDVAETAAGKLRRRHPHVFAGAPAGDAAGLAAQWESLKSGEREGAGTLDGVARALPALVRAAKLQKRAAAAGFDWAGIEPVLGKVDEEVREVRSALAPGSPALAVEGELGDLLFACVNLCRHAGVDPESALRGANRKFERRFRYIESRLAAAGTVPDQSSLAEMDALWEEAKRNEEG